MLVMIMEYPPCHVKFQFTPCQGDSGAGMRFRCPGHLFLVSVLNQHIIPWTAIEDVRTGAAFEDVVPLTTEKCVRTVTADYNVVPRPTVNGQVDHTRFKVRSVQDVIASRKKDHKLIKSGIGPGDVYGCSESGNGNLGG